MVIWFMIACIVKNKKCLSDMVPFLANITAYSSQTLKKDANDIQNLYSLTFTIFNNLYY